MAREAGPRAVQAVHLHYWHKRLRYAVAAFPDRLLAIIEYYIKKIFIETGNAIRLFWDF